MVLRAFTSRAIAAMTPEIEQLCHDLIDQFPNGPFDLLCAYCEQVPVVLIARLLGVPEHMSGTGASPPPISLLSSPSDPAAGGGAAVAVAFGFA